MNSHSYWIVISLFLIEPTSFSNDSLTILEMFVSDLHRVFGTFYYNRADKIHL